MLNLRVVMLLLALLWINLPASASIATTISSTSFKKMIKSHFKYFSATGITCNMSSQFSILYVCTHNHN